MLIKITTIHEEIINFNSAQGHKKYIIEEVYINPLHVVYLKEDIQYIELNVKGSLPEGFPKGQKFTRICLNRGSMGEEFTVVGDLKGLSIKINEVSNGN